MQIRRAPWYLYPWLYKKVVRAKMFVMHERLPPSPPPVNFILSRLYQQFMERMECCDEMEPSEWGWKMEGDKLFQC